MVYLSAIDEDARLIIHADMDAFYASVEILLNPQLKGLPVAVGGPSRTRGVISAANYIARQYGVRSALPTASAVRKCSQLILLPPRMGLYAEYSDKIQRIFARYTPLIEPLSLDEAFLDVHGSERLFGPPETIGRAIKQAVAVEVGLVVSIGIAANKFIAKIASEFGKPDGFVVVSPENSRSFLDPLPVRRLWGVGETTAGALEAMGIKNIGELRQRPQDFLLRQFGQHGLHLWRLANGIDERHVEPDHKAKSISHETTFYDAIDELEILLSHLSELTEQVTSRLRRNQLRGRTITLKIRYADFTTLTRSHTLARATYATKTVWQAAKQLLLTRVPLKHKAVRLIGVGVSGFEQDAGQTELFAHNADLQEKIDDVADQIKKRFGQSGLRRGKSLANK